jgi:hypothetical protein
MRSLLAPWVGGAAQPAEAPAAAPGYRSLLAFWTGGAGSGIAAEVPDVVPRLRRLYVPTADTTDDEDDILAALAGMLCATAGRVMH